MAVPQGLFYRVLGQRLRNARREVGVTQIKLANIVGLSRSSIANIESGRQPVYIHALVSIAGQLGIPLTDLIPPEDVADEQRIEGELKKLGAQQRHWVVRILKPLNQEKEAYGTEVRVIKKARRAIAAAGESKKATDPNRKARNPVKGRDKTSAFLR